MNAEFNMRNNVRRRVGQFVTAALGLMLTGTALLAQDPKVFNPISTQPEQPVSAAPYILAAYGLVWVAVFIYVFSLWRRLGKVEHELAEVNAQLAKRARR